MDTIIIRNSYEANFFNRKYNGQHRSCYESAVNVNYPISVFSSTSEMEMDSLTITGDTVWFSSSLYFLPHALLGQSWMLNSYLITCSDFGETQFLGINDSIKEFTGFPNCTIILSKHHGFLSYIPFNKIAQNNFSLHNLVGFSDSTGNYGFRKPNYLDFIPYHAGDILNWESHSEPTWGPWSVSYHQDSITSISFGSDTIIYSYDYRGIGVNGLYYSGQNQIKKLLVSDLYSTLESPTNWFSLHTFMSTSISVLGSESYTIESDSSISFRLTNDGLYFSDSISCSLYQYPDEATHYTYNTSQGFTEYRYDAFYPYQYYTILVGSRINGIIKGNINLPLNTNEINSQNIIYLNLNPENSTLILKSAKPIRDISIIDLLGNIVYNSKINSLETSINISALHSSIYFVIISTNDGRVTCRKLFKN